MTIGQSDPFAPTPQEREEIMEQEIERRLEQFRRQLLGE